MKNLEFLTTTDFQALVKNRGLENITDTNIKKELEYELAYGLFDYEVPEKFNTIVKWDYNPTNRHLIVSYK